MQTTTLSTGYESLNVAIGGGLPVGRVTEISGAGAQHIAVVAMIAAQKAGVTCAYIDGRHTFDAAQAQALGCDISSLLVAQPDHRDQAIEITEILAKSAAVGLIVVETETMLTRAEALQYRDPEYLQSPDARTLSQALRILTATAYKTGCVVLFVREGKTVPLQGINNALKFYASIRIELTKSNNTITAKVLKNKMAPPFETVTIDVGSFLFTSKTSTGSVKPMRRDDHNVAAAKLSTSLVESFPMATQSKSFGVFRVLGIPGTHRVCTRAGVAVVWFSPNHSESYDLAQGTKVILKKIIDAIALYVVAAYRVAQRAAELPLTPINGSKLDAPWELGSVVV